MISIGIDPGLSGAIVAYGPAGVIDGADMPTKPSALPGASIKRRVDGKAVLEILRRLAPANEAAHVTIELVEGRGPKSMNGTSSLMSTAETYGVLRAAIEIAGLPFTEVRSSVWKKPLGLMGKGSPKGPAAKEAARQKAIKLMPAMASTLQRKKDHNRAEAALIARHGYEQHA